MSRLTQLLEFLKESPEDPFLLFAIAKEYEKQSEIDQALAQYQDLVNNHPDYVGTYYHYGKIREQKGQLEEAIQIYQKGMDVAKKQGDQHALGELAAAKLNIDD